MLALCMEELVNEHISKTALNFPCLTLLPFPAPSTSGEHRSTILINHSDVWLAVLFPGSTSQACSDTCGLVPNGARRLRRMRLAPCVTSAVSQERVQA